MGRLFSNLLSFGLFFAAFSASSHYSLQNYSIGSGGTNSTTSAHYGLQGNTGEVAGPPSSSAHFTTKSGSIQAEQANVPPAPTLSNGGGTYYNRLGLTIGTGGNPADATYAVAISSNSFATTSYVQSDGSLGASQYFQSYTGWGGAGGSFIIGLVPSTTYQVEVSAMTGRFTQSAYGAPASATTTNPSITFSLSPSSQALGSLLGNTIITAPSNLNFNLSTNADYGANIYVAGQYGGLHSVLAGYTIPAYSGDLNTPSEGFGIQDVSASAPITAVSPYNVSGTNVGGESSTFATIFSSSSPITSGTASSVVKAKASNATPTSNDYAESLTFIAAATF